MTQRFLYKSSIVWKEMLADKPGNFDFLTGNNNEIHIYDGRHETDVLDYTGAG